MNAQRLTEAAFLIGIAFGSSLVTQEPSLNYPSARRADVIDNCFGTKVAERSATSTHCRSGTLCN